MWTSLDVEYMYVVREMLYMVNSLMRLKYKFDNVHLLCNLAKEKAILVS